MNRLGLAVVAVGVTLAGVAVLLEPGLAAGVSSDYLLVIGIGGAMILVGLSRAYRARRRRRNPVALGHPESLAEYPTPGDALDGRWDDYRMRSVAVQILRRSRGCTGAEARRMLDRGTWTGDETAAAYFTAGPEEASIVGRGLRLVGRLRRRSRRRRALLALAEEANLEPEGHTP